MMSENPNRWTRALRIAAVTGGLFGLVTLAGAGGVLFGPDAARDAAGDIVPFIVWFNFLAGFAYLAAAAGLWQGRVWAGWLAAAIAGGTAIAAFWFAAVAVGGAEVELRTAGALGLRFAFWAGIATLALRGARA